MADFLADFKRRESQSSEGSLGEEDDDYEPQFAQEQINHHSDEEQGETKTNTRTTNAKKYSNEENKQIRVNEQRKNGSSPNKNQQKKDYYLYQGEEKPYESDPEDQNQGGKGGKNPDQKNDKKLPKDPTFVPKGTFYQHDTRGEEVEFVPKKNSDKFGKSKWKHDKFDKPYNPKANKEKVEGGNNFYDKKARVVYVAKGEKQPEEEDTQKQQQPQPKAQQQAQRPRNQEQKQYYKKPNYDKEKDRGYGNKQQVEYVKKDSTKKNPAENTNQPKARDNRDYYVEYVPKKQENK